MVLNLQDKQAIVYEVNKIAKHALSAVIADYRGVSVDQLTELRKLCRISGVYIRVIRNTLMRRIVENTNFECLKNVFIGSNLIAFSNEHPGIAARLFKNFAIKNSNFKIKAAAFEGKIIPVSQIDRLASLPTYEEAIIHLISVIREASASKLIRILIALGYQKQQD